MPGGWSQVGVVCLVLVGTRAEAVDPATPSPYAIPRPLENAVIHYETLTVYGHESGRKKSGGGAQRGTEVSYIRGAAHAKLMKLTERRAEGRPATIERLQIVTPEHVYEIDLAAQRGTRIDRGRADAEIAYEKLSQEDKRVILRRLRESGVESLDLAALGTKVGTGRVLGRLCDLYELGAPLDSLGWVNALASDADRVHMRTWVWRGTNVPLRITVDRFGVHQEVRATKIDTRTPVPEERVRVPAGVTIVHDAERSERARQEALATLERLRTGSPQVIRLKVPARPAPLEHGQ